MKNLLIVFIALLSYTGILHAQPSNDECSGAIPLLLNYDSDYQPMNLSLSTTSQFIGLTSIEELIGQQFSYPPTEVGQENHPRYLPKISLSTKKRSSVMYLQQSILSNKILVIFLFS